MSDLPPTLPPGAETLSIVLPHKPSASLSCTFIKGTTNILIVFLNGLGLPQSHWWPCITQLLSLDPIHPSILTYDRYGQGLTADPDPQDGGQSPLPPGHRHDLISVTKDLRILIDTISKTQQILLSETPLIFVANSIGCPLARCYSQTYPATVAGLVLLDSYMTDTNFIDLYPDPDAPNFDQHSLLDGITVEDIRSAREGMGKLFHPSVTNKEGFWRGNITFLLPHSFEPKLLGWKEENIGGKGPYVTVVGHDWDVFAEESLRMKGMTKAVAMAYTNPAWGLYNEGLLKITNEERGRRLIASRAGHFIQQGRPDLVAEEVQKVVVSVAEEASP
ncbi:hypothetical protein AOL_s00173g65 [Orbilia oligospora ATCC 24927]|uniref:AB hydrolase-1 domain-containing protein n=2 Tax=Orbilia oligospora TaxID=2813651 RepID=G1XNP7_ARTOA|nr:hypothetical protein AOL_s00173g65 [Orbilia oligospora ATCC 24927]EGX44964.1 hypothetical protein AOL_s00173g65 [Orbilia oligospora ATCC 24927]KAF3286661.1 hypothetical protein TWF970_008509 [Orbilia oligospora]